MSWYVIKYFQHNQRPHSLYYWTDHHKQQRSTQTFEQTEPYNTLAFAYQGGSYMIQFKSQQALDMRYFRLLPWSRRELCFSLLLHSE